MKKTCPDLQALTAQVSTVPSESHHRCSWLAALQGCLLTDGLRLRSLIDDKNTMVMGFRIVNIVFFVMVHNYMVNTILNYHAGVNDIASITHR